MTDEEFEEAAIQALQGSATGSTGAEELAATLLGLTGEVVKMAVLLAESDEEEWRVIGPRLAVFRSVVEQLPATPRTRRRMGFRLSPKTKRRRKR